MKICVQKINRKKVIDTSDTIDITDDPIDAIDTNDKIIDTDTTHKLNPTLIVGPSFCAKTHLLLSKLQIIRLDNPEQKIRISTSSPEQYSKAGFAYTNTEIEDVSVEDLQDRTIQVFLNFCVVFDDMLDSNQKLIDPFFTRGRHNESDVYYLS